MSSLLKHAFALLSPAGGKARLTTLIFHRVLAKPDPLFPEEMDAERFAALLAWLRLWFNVLPLDQAVKHMQQGSLPARAAAITFDDGYADNCTVAMPLLQRAGMSATFFVATGFLDGGRMWNDTVIEALRKTALESLDLRGVAPEFGDLPSLPLTSWGERRAAAEASIGRVKYLQPARRLQLVEAIAKHCAANLANDLMLSTSQLRLMQSKGMGIGAHTIHHPILARLEPQEAHVEIAQSRALLEEVLGQRVGLFAYPNGKPGEDYLPANVAQVRSLGFDAAVSTTPGVAHAGTDLFQLPRFTPWDRQQWKFGARLVQNLRRDKSNLQQAVAV